MKWNRKTALLVVLGVVCLGVQVAALIYSARWESRWHSLFNKADELQTSIHQLEAEHAEPGKIDGKRQELQETMTEIRQTYRPDHLLRPLQVAASIGVLLIVVALWWMRSKPGDTEPAEQGH